MDKVFIAGLEVLCTIGAYDWEKSLKQKLIFDLEMDYDNRPAGETDDLARGLGQLVPQPALIGALGTASWWLARAGLLEGYRATIHWQEIHRFAESFPHVVVSSNLFEIDRDRATCAGGAATLDFMLALISQTQGNDFVAQLSELFSMERMRPGNERQRIPLATRIGGSQPKLTEAVALMEAMAVGIPVVSTLHSGIPELIKSDHSGWLVPENNAMALADRLAAFSDIDQQALEPVLHNARQKVETDFNQQVINRQLASLLQTL